MVSKALSTPVIAIDGPSASGKGTISRRLAERLGWHLLDSGALYRLVALAAEQKGVDLADQVGLSELAAQMAVEFRAEASSDDTLIILNGDPVGPELRSERMGNAASIVAAVPAVRDALLMRQRQFRRAPGLVADGRDMGTVVFPGAELKVFLTASAEERAKRRHKQLREKGLAATIRSLLDEIEARDARDQNRAVAPLKAADDAVIIDTSHMDIEQVVQALLDLCSKRLNLKV